MELLEYNSLGFNFTDLFSDHSLSHLSKDGQALLNDHNALGVTDKFVLGNDVLREGSMREVINTVEIIKTCKKLSVRQNITKVGTYD